MGYGASALFLDRLAALAGRVPRPREPGREPRLAPQARALAL
jgi:hypothetical protein